MPVTKSLLLCLLALAATLQLRAQTKIWITGGVNFSGAKIKNIYSPGATSQSQKTGFHLGTFAAIPVGTHFSLEPVLEYITKGYRYTTAVPVPGSVASAPVEYVTQQDMKPAFLQLPLHFVYKPRIGQNALLIGAGPYFAYGTGGKSKRTSYYTGGQQVDKSTSNLKFKHDLGEQPVEFYLLSSATANYSYSEPDIVYSQPLDIGISALLGFELHGRCRIQLNSQIGLKNVAAPYKGQKKQDVLKNRSFGLSLGYRF
ncbi:MAG: PorT family protein [Niabella sp.]|nr:PorT family protein [Niabella sp.]